MQKEVLISAAWKSLPVFLGVLGYIVGLVWPIGFQAFCGGV